VESFKEREEIEGWKMQVANSVEYASAVLALDSLIEDSGGTTEEAKTSEVSGDIMEEAIYST